MNRFIATLSHALSFAVKERRLVARNPVSDIAETAQRRAVARAQERLRPEETERAYKEIYFPAQELQFQRDAPRDAASHILKNDGY